MPAKPTAAGSWLDHVGAVARVARCGQRLVEGVPVQLAERACWAVRVTAVAVGGSPRPPRLQPLGPPAVGVGQADRAEVLGGPGPGQPVQGGRAGPLVGRSPAREVGGRRRPAARRSHGWRARRTPGAGAPARSRASATRGRRGGAQVRVRNAPDDRRGALGAVPRAPARARRRCAGPGRRPRSGSAAPAGRPGAKVGRGRASSGRQRVERAKRAASWRRRGRRRLRPGTRRPAIGGSGTQRVAHGRFQAALGGWSRAGWARPGSSR